MPKPTYKDLLEAGVHFGHLRKKWNPKMAPFIFMERKGIHIIDLNKTLEHLEDSANALRTIARSGKKVLFVATKKQSKELVAAAAQRIGMPYVTERWLGGMLTNFSTIRKSIKKMQGIEKLLTDGTGENLTKKERLTLSREKEKLEKTLGGIANMARIPSAIVMVDVTHEKIALLEAQKLNMQTFALVDTNSDPTIVDFAIPANDDASKSVAIIIDYLAEAISEGLQERKIDKADDGESDAEMEARDRAAALAEENKRDGGRDNRRDNRGGNRGGPGGGNRGPGGGGGNRGPGGGGGNRGGGGGGPRR